MSISSTQLILNRIESATKRSKIALFREYQGRRMFVNAVFDNTYLTQQKIKNGHTDYVGSYYGNEGALRALQDINDA